MEKKDYEEVAHLMKVIIENELRPQLNLIFEKLESIEARLPREEDTERMEDRLDVLEAVARTHSRDIAALKKAQ